MHQVLDLYRHILQNGHYKGDRTGKGTISTFGGLMRFDLKGYRIPVVTTKYVHLKSVIHELLWFLKGETNIRYLKQHGVRIWDEWVKAGTEEYIDYTAPKRAIAFIPMDQQDKLKAFFDYLKDYVSETPKEGYVTREGVKEYIHPDIDAIGHQWLDDHKVGGSAHYLMAGELGPIYGAQWRHRKSHKRKPLTQAERKAKIDALYAEKGVDDIDIEAQRKAITDAVLNTTEEFSLWENIEIDQIQYAIDLLRNDPDSRRIIVDAWNPAEIEDQALTPCHNYFQFYTRLKTKDELLCFIDSRFSAAVMTSLKTELGDDPELEALREWCKAHSVPVRYLSCHFNLRSNDVFLGCPFNIASYAILTRMVAQVVGMDTEELVWTGGDVHIYTDHVDAVKEQLTREPYDPPVLFLDPDVTEIDQFQFHHFHIDDYKYHPAIKAKVSV